MDRTVIVVPCLNEAARLRVQTFVDFARQTPGVRFLFVNDGSTDDTGLILTRLRDQHPEAFSLVHLERNAGKAEAVRRGLNEAIRSGSDFVAFWDADLSTGLEEVDQFRCILRSRPDIEMVFGARVNLLGRRIERALARHYLGRLFATVTAFALRLPIYDTQCGAKMFRVTDDLRAVLETPFISRWIFDVEIIARFLVCRRNGGPPLRDVIVEQPLIRWTDVKGSKVRPRHFVLLAGDFVRIYARYLRQIEGHL